LPKVRGDGEKKNQRIRPYFIAQGDAVGIGKRKKGRIGSGKLAGV